MVSAVNIENTGRNPLAFFNDVAWMQKISFSQLRDMDEPFQPFIYTGKGAKTDDVGDLGFDHLADLIALVNQRPGIGLEALEAEGHPMLLWLNPHDIYLDLIAGPDHVRRMVYPPPGKL